VVRYAPLFFTCERPALVLEDLADGDLIQGIRPEPVHRFCGKFRVSKERARVSDIPVGNETMPPERRDSAHCLMPSAVGLMSFAIFYWAVTMEGSSTSGWLDEILLLRCGVTYSKRCMQLAI
jgi:hypothetical protein